MLAVATRVTKPVVVVPPEPRNPPSAGLQRVLVPLDGTATTARSREFLARNPPASGTRLEVRCGWPSDRILEVAAIERADMIALGWRRRLAPDRAAVVRDVLALGPVPVVLLPYAA